jgi:putative transposase
LKRLLADAMLDNAAMKELLRKNGDAAAHREAVAHLRTAYEMSERWACCIMGCDRASVRYQAKRPDDAPLSERLRALAHERRRFGYRRLHVLLRREGYGVNRKRIYRLYREERLMVRKRSGRKRALGTRAPMVLPMAADMRWSLDFVSDQMTSGRRFRILCVVDDCTRECLALIADTSLSGLRVARELDAIMAWRGSPPPSLATMGTELTGKRSSAGLKVTTSSGITSHPASRRRMALSRASTAACGVSCLTRRCSARCVSACNFDPLMECAPEAGQD